MDYAKRIRQEYSFVEEQLYRQKRPEVLLKLVQSEPYKTKLFQDMCMEHAIRNVDIEIDKLKNDDTFL